MKVLHLKNIDALPHNTAITIGMFDGVHKGHQLMLSLLKEKAKNLGLKSMVITFNNHPQSVLKPEKKLNLLQDNSQRFNCIEALEVDYLLLIDFSKEFAILSPKQFLDILIDKVNPKLLILGYDNSFGNPQSNDFDDITSEGYYKDIRIIREEAGLYYGDIEISSTEIRKAVSKGNIPLANAMLSRPYALHSKVEKGYQVGRTLGFPTANIYASKDKLLPSNGVYATKIFVNNTEYKSVTNIGTRPTFHRQDVSIETFILDFQGDIYGQEIDLYFYDRIRDEQFFSSPEELQNQIKKDISRAEKILD